MNVSRFEFDDELDADNDMCIDVKTDWDENDQYGYIDKGDAVKIIKHLQKVFKIPS